MGKYEAAIIGQVGKYEALRWWILAMASGQVRSFTMVDSGYRQVGKYEALRWWILAIGKRASMRLYDGFWLSASGQV